MTIFKQLFGFSETLNSDNKEVKIEQEVKEEQKGQEPEAFRFGEWKVGSKVYVFTTQYQEDWNVKLGTIIKVVPDGSGKVIISISFPDGNIYPFMAGAYAENRTSTSEYYSSDVTIYLNAIDLIDRLRREKKAWVYSLQNEQYDLNQEQSWLKLVNEPTIENFIQFYIEKHRKEHESSMKNAKIRVEQCRRNLNTIKRLIKKLKIYERNNKPTSEV